MSDVDSARVVPLQVPALCCLGDGWPFRDRAVDAPAVQDVPAWDGVVAWLLKVVGSLPSWSLENVSFAERL
jgi:hypothetical protein